MTLQSTVMPGVFGTYVICVMQIDMVVLPMENKRR